MKIVGAFLLLGALGGAVLCLSAWERKKEKELSALLMLLEHIKGGMLHERLPLGDIYASFENRALKDSGFWEEVCRNGLFSALSSDLLSVPREELSFLFTYAENLGKRFAEEEIRETERAMALLSHRLERHKTEDFKKYKLQKTLIVTAGGMFLLLLL